MSANVRGSLPYRVELWAEDEEMGYSCTCPFYRDTEAFCKHCVAVGLAFLKQVNRRESGGARKPSKSGRDMTAKDIRAVLLTRDKESLADMLLRHAEENDRLRGQLMMMASKSGKKVDLRSFQSAINETLSWEGFVDYKSMYEYTQGIRDVIDSLRELLKDNRAGDVIELSEYFLRRLESQVEMVDDSDGYMGDILTEIQELHHAACLKAKPDPVKLAKKLFQWELASEWDVFSGAVDLYADVLGEHGLESYRVQAEKKWSDIPTLGPGDEERSYAGKRFRITSIMEQLAARTKDVEKLVVVKARDLSSAYNFLEIAETYRKAGKKAQAVEWAEKGLKAFPRETDSRLREFLANEYHALDRHEEAMKLIWAELTDHPRFEEYKRLKTHAVKAGGPEAWATWREKALRFIRTGIDRAKKSGKNYRWAWDQPTRSDLVEIFLWEKNVDQAWREAQEGSCSNSLWLKLAEKRENAHPEDALKVYRRFVEPTLARKNNESYEEAVVLLSKIDKILKRLERTKEWKGYLQELRSNHKRKRNFISLLDKLK